MKDAAALQEVAAPEEVAASLAVLQPTDCAAAERAARALRRHAEQSPEVLQAHRVEVLRLAMAEQDQKRVEPPRCGRWKTAAGAERVPNQELSRSGLCVESLEQLLRLNGKPGA